MYSSSQETHLKATERHLPYGVTQFYLPPDRGECAMPEPQPDRPVLDLITPEGWKAELTLVLVIIPRCFTCPITHLHPSTKHLTPVASIPIPGGLAQLAPSEK